MIEGRQAGAPSLGEAMSSYVLSLLLAVIACVIGGTLGGMILARPATLLEAAGLSDDQAPKASLLAEGAPWVGC